MTAHEFADRFRLSKTNTCLVNIAAVLFFAPSQTFAVVFVCAAHDARKGWAEIKQVKKFGASTNFQIT